MSESSWVIELRQEWENRYKQCIMCDTYHVAVDDDVATQRFVCETCTIVHRYFTGIVAQCCEMIYPIAVLAVMICVYVEWIGIPARDSGLLGFHYALHYNELENDSIEQKILGAMINGAFVLVATLLLTIVFLIGILINYKRSIRASIRFLFAAISISSISYFVL
jgi:hypothetical protein